MTVESNFKHIKLRGLCIQTLNFVLVFCFCLLAFFLVCPKNQVRKYYYFISLFLSACFAMRFKLIKILVYWGILSAFSEASSYFCLELNRKKITIEVGIEVPFLLYIIKFKVSWTSQCLFVPHPFITLDPCSHSAR